MMTNYRNVYLFESVALILLGLLAIVFPHLFTLGIERMLGWIFLAAGLIQFYRVYKIRYMPRGGHFLNAVLYTIAGLILLAYPREGIMALTLNLMVFYLLDGLSKLVMGFQLHPASVWKWFAANGILSWGMAYILWRGWPDMAYWFPGMLAGINLIYYGFSLLRLSTRFPHPKTP